MSSVWLDGYEFYLYIIYMSTKRRPGRPPKRSGQLKSDSMLVRLETDEKRAFCDAAILAGIDLSTWARERLRRSAIRELEEAGKLVAFLAGKHGGRP